VLEHWIEKLAGFFWVALRQKFHRALEISKQNSDLLPFTFKGSLRSEDLLGEVFRGIALG